MNNLLIIILLSVFFILMIINQYLYRENFTSKKLLSPIKGLGGECKKINKDYKPAFMPSICIKDGKLNSFANCKCTNNNGECKVCYPEIKKDKKDSSVVYNPNEYNKKNKQ